MPMGWVEPEVFLEHKDVTVYHVYHNDCIDDGARMYWYTIDSDYGEDNGGEAEGVFDIRDYSNPNNHDTDTFKGQEALMRELIELGVLGADGVVHPELDREEIVEEVD